ncbi:hypothetical protein INR49_029015 [Caranx melampygus]|nr:hypothetical protein INR49_029015 [Caranx melampygus]
MFLTDNGASRAALRHEGRRKSAMTKEEETKRRAKQEAQIEESVGQRLLNMEEEKKQRERELESLEEQLRQCTAKSQMTDSELQFLKGELESLKNTEHELDTLQTEVDEDTTEVIPSAVYMAQLYYVITRIKWEYDTPPNVLKGVHYGADLATPINIDTSARSRNDVSDQLWGFEGYPDLLHLSVFCQEAGSAEQPEDGPPHVLAGQGVDNGIQKGVEHGDAQEVVCLVEHFALLGWTAEVQQQEDEEGQPTRDEDNHNYGDSLQQGQVLLGLAVKAFAVWDRGQALGVGLDNTEDADIEHHDGQEDGTEDGDAEQDVTLGVERQDCGALRQLSHTVPAQNGQHPQQHRQHPARTNQSKHPALFVSLVRLHPDHGDMALYGNGQQTDDRRSQHDEHTPLPQEPQHRGHV